MERGKKLKRSWARFFDEDTYLENQAYLEGEKDMRMNAVSDPSE